MSQPQSINIAVDNRNYLKIKTRMMMSSSVPMPIYICFSFCNLRCLYLNTARACNLFVKSHWHRADSRYYFRTLAGAA